jgi:hypothetical protein
MCVCVRAWEFLADWPIRPIAGPFVCVCVGGGGVAGGPSKFFLFFVIVKISIVTLACVSLCVSVGRSIDQWTLLCVHVLLLSRLTTIDPNANTTHAHMHMQVACKTISNLVTRAGINDLTGLQVSQSVSQPASLLICLSQSVSQLVSQSDTQIQCGINVIYEIYPPPPRNPHTTNPHTHARKNNRAGSTCRGRSRRSSTFSPTTCSR